MMPRHRDSVTVTSGRGSPAVRPGLKIFSLECRSDHTSIDWSTRERTSLRSMRCSYGRKATMPQYSFTIRSSDHEHKAERCVVLQDVAAALDHACRIVRELSAKGYNDPGLLVSVRNEMREIVLSVPFLAACA
jgi:hypothetical protein